jgi:hypothetical protein
MTRAQIERHFRRAVSRWRPVLGLADWQVFVHVEPVEDGACAGTSARPEYREATIALDPDAVARDAKLYPDARHVEYLALHELAHVLTWTLYAHIEAHRPDAAAQWHIENTTSQVAGALWRARYGSQPPEGA